MGKHQSLLLTVIWKDIFYVHTLSNGFVMFGVFEQQSEYRWGKVKAQPSHLNECLIYRIENKNKQNRDCYDPTSFLSKKV